MSIEKEETMVGVPTLAFLPAKKFYFKVLKDKHEIVVPLKSDYVDLDPDFFDVSDGSYALVSDDRSIFNIAMITKVLFAANKYPDLKYNELFCPTVMVVAEDELHIYGRVIVMLEPEG